jgi:hypothetical protein
MMVDANKNNNYIKTSQQPQIEGAAHQPAADAQSSVKKEEGKLDDRESVRH